MPSIQMKTKLTMSCLKEKKDIGVCRRSTLISKNHLCHNGVSKTVEDIYTCAQNNKDALVSGKVHFEDIENKWANNDELCGEKLFEKQPSALSNSHTDSLEEPLSSTFPSNTDTFFSPILESIDFYSNEGIDSLFVPRLHTEDSEESSRSSCEIQACNVSDFYISDIIFSGSPIRCPSELENKIETSFLSDYKCEESSLVCDLKEDFMILPFLEDAVDAECNHSRPSEVTITGADNSSFYMAIHQLQSDNHDSYINTHSDQGYECFDPQMYIRSLPYQPEITCTLLPRTVPNEQLNVKRITLVLDLDETLVHSTLDPCRDADFTFTVLFNMKEHVVYVKQRPHLQTFLKRVAEMFDVVVFTASQSIYAEQILDILDPDGMVISRRAYRESCVFSDGTYMKDLTVLGVDLAKVVIIDNSPQVFRLQVNNGIPIKSWFSDSSDSALLSLLPFLETLADADDVRPIIARKFGNKE